MHSQLQLQLVHTGTSIYRACVLGNHYTLRYTLPVHWSWLLCSQTTARK